MSQEVKDEDDDTPSFMYFPSRNRQIVQAKRIYNIDVNRGKRRTEVLISYEDSDGSKRQIQVIDVIPK